MTNDISVQNMKLRQTYSISHLLCFSCFVIWQMGVIYFSGTALSVYGRTPLPIDIDRVTTLIAVGYLVSILFMCIIPQFIVLAERISSIVALVSILLFYLPLPETVLLILFYIHIFSCIFIIGFENAIMVHLFSELALIKHLLVCYPFACFVVALIQNEVFPVPFAAFHLLTVVCLICLIYFAFKLPANVWPKLATKKCGLPYPKQLFAGVYLFSFIGGVLCLFGSALAETIPHGVSIYYIATSVWLFLLYILWKAKNIHPLRSVSAFAAISAFGFMVAFASLSIPAFGYLACILLASGMSVLSLYPMMQIVMFKQYPSRFISPIIIAMALLSVVVQSTLIELFRNDFQTMYLIFGIIAVGMTLLYLVLEPHLIFSFQERTTDRLAETEEIIDAPETNTSWDTIHENAFDKISPREREIAELILLGYTNGEMAEKMGITVGTVKVYRQNLYSKLQIHSKRELFELANKNSDR